MTSQRSRNTAGDELKLSAVRMNSRSVKRKTCICCHVSKFSSDVCVSVYVSVTVCMHTDLCSLLSPRLCFLPSLKWVVGAFQHLSITEKDEEEVEEAFLQQDRKGL